jgi:hypothetical protein
MPARSVLLLTALLAGGGIAAHIASPATATAVAESQETRFARLIERLSEPGGYFQSDNLVSNEASYLHVLGRMSEVGVKGGAYIGVGPDQNFSYIAAIRPEIAFLIDIRRDNLLHHLLFKSLFENARNRLEYLCLMTGRALPEDLKSWDRTDILEVVEYVDLMPPDSAAFETAHARLRRSIDRYGVPLSPEDLETIRRFHGEFARWGLDIRYSTRFGYPLWNMPAWRELILETDLDGRRANYLADENTFRWLKDMQRKDRIVPVVGDLAGDHALAAVGREIADRMLRVSAFYVSNVEQYLMRNGVFDRFATNVAGLPIDERSVFIRSYFARAGRHPQNVPGYYATQLLERMQDFVSESANGGYLSYYDVVTRRVLPPRD